MTSLAPPVVQQAERVLVEVERTVRRFARFHKYSYGSDLRAAAMKVAKLSHRTWRDRDRQAYWVERLKWATDDLKLSLQLGKRIEAFPGFAAFEELARLAADLGRQVGGLHKRHHPKGQSDRRIDGDQRAQILSSRAASAEARS